MPIFEYECKECQHRFEILRIIKKDEDNLSCPQCGAGNVFKLLSPFSSGSDTGNTKTDSCSSGSFT